VHQGTSSGMTDRAAETRGGTSAQRPSRTVGGLRGRKSHGCVHAFAGAGPVRSRWVWCWFDAGTGVDPPGSVGPFPLGTRGRLCQPPSNGPIVRRPVFMGRFCAAQSPTFHSPFRSPFRTSGDCPTASGRRHQPKLYSAYVGGTRRSEDTLQAVAEPPV
jgi:hypothetical protein